AMADIAAMGDGVVIAASQTGRSIGAPLAVVRELLIDSLERAERAGIPREQIVLDPGIGFFTQSSVPATVFNCELLNELESLVELGQPLLVGVSRKSFIGKITGRTDPAERLWGSLAATAIAVYNGAAVIRTHDVAATRDAIRMAEAIRAGNGN